MPTAPSSPTRCPPTGADLDLPFDARCLRFDETPRAIHTPSAQQVRQPINREGLERWRNYEPWLRPLKDALAPQSDR